MMQLGKLLNAFEALQITHCDFKKDQLAVGANGTLKIVDLKAFHDSPFSCCGPERMQGWNSGAGFRCVGATREFEGQLGLSVAGFVKSQFVEPTRHRRRLVTRGRGTREPANIAMKPPSPRSFHDDTALLLNSINNTDPKKRLNAAEFYEATLKMFIENGGMECLVGAADVYTEVAQYLNETRHTRHAQSEYCASNRYC